MSSDTSQPTASAAQPASGRLRQGKLWLARFVLLGIVSLVCVGVLEILVRILMPHYNPRNQLLIRRTPEGVVLGISNLRTTQGTPKGDFLMEVAFNRHGFRDTKDFVNARADDLFTVGDSFSIGWGVEEEERFSNVLQKALGRPVYNVAIPEDIRGYQQTVGHVERNGGKPKHLILGLCMENDLWDYEQPVSTHELYHQQMIRTWRHKTAFWCKRHSALWTALSHTLQRHAWIRRIFEKVGVARNIDQLTHKNEASPQILASSRNELLKLATNYHTVVLVIPSRALWYGKHVDEEKQVHAQFVGLLRAAGLELVDMKPLFEKDGDPLSFYFKTDPHWNARGHALAAQALRDYLAQAEGWQFLKTPGPASTSPPPR